MLVMKKATNICLPVAQLRTFEEEEEEEFGDSRGTGLEALMEDKLTNICD